MRLPLRGFDHVRRRIAREAAKLSHAELARLTGIGPSTYSQWELGTSHPRPAHWCAAHSISAET